MTKYAVRMTDKGYQIFSKNTGEVFKFSKGKNKGKELTLISTTISNSNDWIMGTVEEGVIFFNLSSGKLCKDVFVDGSLPDSRGFTIVTLNGGAGKKLFNVEAELCFPDVKCSSVGMPDQYGFFAFEDAQTKKWRLCNAYVIDKTANGPCTHIYDGQFESFESATVANVMKKHPNEIAFLPEKYRKICFPSATGVTCATAAKATFLKSSQGRRMV